MKEGYYSGEVIDMWFEEGILIGMYKVENVDLNVAKLATQERLAFIKGTAYPCLADYTKVKSTSKDARDFFATEESSSLMTSLAVLTDSNLGKVIVNFYLQISKPKFPTKLFTDREEALTWLKKFK